MCIPVYAAIFFHYLVLVLTQQWIADVRRLDDDDEEELDQEIGGDTAKTESQEAPKMDQFACPTSVHWDGETPGTDLYIDSTTMTVLAMDGRRRWLDIEKLVCTLLHSIFPALIWKGDKRIGRTLAHKCFRWEEHCRNGTAVNSVVVEACVMNGTATKLGFFDQCKFRLHIVLILLHFAWSGKKWRLVRSCYKPGTMCWSACALVDWESPARWQGCFGPSSWGDHEDSPTSFWSQWTSGAPA